MKKLNLFLLILSISLSSFSQNLIKGIVTDEFNTPLPNVTIILKGTQKGTLTDFDGNFEIETTKGQVLVFSYIGFKTKEVKVSSQTTLNIQLVEDASELDEIVVIGYGKQKKESVLGAINQIKGEEITQTGTPNMVNALNALTPGLVIVQSTGEPGVDEGEIFIRGNANPLILVDGVEIVGGFASIDPRDVENVSVLKDGAATAVYGIRGANGVIIITTKRGKIGGPKINLSNQYSVKMVNLLPDMMDAFSAQNARNVAILNDQAYNSGYSTQEALDFWRSGELPYIYPNTDWQETILEDFATSSNHTLSLSGGTDFVRYYASVGFLQEGTIIKSDQLYNYDPTYNYDRYSFRGNLDFTLTKTTTLKTSVSSRLEDRLNPGGVNGVNYAGIYSSEPGGTIPVYPAEVLEQYPDPLYPGLSEPRLGFGPNMYRGVNAAGTTKTNKTVFSMDFELEQDLDFITKGLTFIGKYNYISTYTSRGGGYNFDSSLEPRIDTYTLERDGTWTAEEGRNYERSEYIISGESIANSQDIAYYRAQLAYERTFGKHDVTGMALFSRNKSVFNTQFPFYNEDWVGRFTYNYDKRFFFEVSGAYNGDESFQTGRRFQFFPSYAVGYNLAKEKFIQENFSVLNNFKIRYSYGETGNKSGLRIANTNPAQFQRWQYLSFYDFVTANFQDKRYRFGVDQNEDLIIVDIDQLGNENLTWETVTKQNIGVDFGLFNNKISGLVEFFKDKREGIIQRPSNVIYPQFVGVSTNYPFVNFGETESQGFEFSLTYRDRTESGFSYEFTGFYGFNENRVRLSSQDGPGTPEYAQAAGKPIGATSLLQVDGYFQNIDELVNYPEFAGIPGLGDYRYVDYNANGTVVGSDIEDQVRFDFPTAPKNTYSFRFSFGYKRWSLSGLMSGIFGHEGLINETYAYALPSGNATGINSQLDYWTPTNTDARFPALHVVNQPNLNAATTGRIVDLDYFKLRNLNLGYNFDMSENKSISNLKLYLNGNNLLTITDFEFGNPEGNSPGRYPITTRLNLGLDISF